ncbi:MAG TPA: phytanoyl-CoA dioxygenase family protein [Holophagaceae bacterium]|jgi:ectoine hydroxylase-related dioxygenase (phytanoyl-CoA dioxygenase family)|nr:phytanoyl-CoA dioxygenase family protein [Holophagaceae bacterium]
MAKQASLDALTIEEALYGLETGGYCVVPDFIEPEHCERLKAKLGAAVDAYAPSGSEQSRLDQYLMHDLLARDPVFGRLLDDARLQQLVAPILGEHWIMYAFTSSSLPPGGTNYGHRVHVDCPRFSPAYTFNLGMIWALDPFSRENGGTQLLPGSHHSPSAPSGAYFDQHCVSVECDQGSLILFNARVFHRSGLNRSQAWRHSLTLNACRSFMKQRMDWVRLIPPQISDGLGPQARRLIGFDTRLPASMEEFFLPEDQRLYKPNQG